MSKDITLEQIRPERFSFWIKGTSPLIQHAWSSKGIRSLRMTPAERRKVAKSKRIPEDDAEGATYRTEKGQYGIPAMGFKKALISAAHKDFGLEKTLLKKAVFVVCDDTNDVLPMECDEPVVREDIVRVGVNQTDLRYRPMFRNWRVEIIVEIDTALIQIEHVIKLAERAGFSVGICEWRPEKGGDFGRFTIDTSQPVRGANDG